MYSLCGGGPAGRPGSTQTYIFTPILDGIKDQVLLYRPLAAYAAAEHLFALALVPSGLLPWMPQN